MTTYHIAFAANTAYVPFAIVAMHSIMAHQPRQADESYCFHLITEFESFWARIRMPNW